MSRDLDRLKKLQMEMSPRELVLLWLEEAKTHGCLVDYTRWLVEQPDAAYPLVHIPGVLREGMRRRLKGQSPETVNRKVREAIRDAVFLVELVKHVNLRVMQDLPGLMYRGYHLFEKLTGLIKDKELSDDLSLLRLELSSNLPYPLDQETHAAVRAAQQHAVLTWEMIEEGGSELPDWVAEAYLAEGRTEIPMDAYSRRKYQAAELTEEIGHLFADEEAFAAFLAGTDYLYGLADVPDAEYLPRLDEVYQGLRELVPAEEMMEGRVVVLAPLPHEFLREAPLVAGEWLDREVVLLAEWGALLEKQGFEVRPTEDDHPLSWEGISRDGEEAFGEALALLPRAEEKLGKFPGKTKLIQGREYLALSDYRRWRGRGVKGKLLPVAGLELASFNRWVQEHQEKARLAGVPVHELEPWTKGCPVEECPGREEAGAKQRLRRGLLERLQRWSLHEKGETWARELPTEGRSFRGKVEEWGEEHEAWSRELGQLLAVAALFSRRYFARQEVLFPAEAEGLRALRDWGGEVHGLFREYVSEGNVTPDRKEERTAAVLGTAPANSSLARFLLDMAKAEALERVGEERAAEKLVKSHLTRPLAEQ